MSGSASGTLSASRWAPASSVCRDSNFLLFCLFVEVLLVAGFFLNRGWAPRPIAGRVVGPQTTYNARSDPPLHRPAPPLRVVTESGIPVSLTEGADVPGLIAFFSDCTGCALGRIHQLEALQSQWRGGPVAVVFAGAPDPGFLRANDIRVPAYFEGTAGSTAAYNLAWRPRLVLLDRAGHITYLQPIEESFDVALRRVQSVAREPNVQHRVGTASRGAR